MSVHRYNLSETELLGEKCQNLDSFMLFIIFFLLSTKSTKNSRKNDGSHKYIAWELID